MDRFVILGKAENSSLESWRLLLADQDFKSVKTVEIDTNKLISLIEQSSIKEDYIISRDNPNKTTVMPKSFDNLHTMVLGGQDSLYEYVLLGVTKNKKIGVVYNTKTGTIIKSDIRAFKNGVYIRIENSKTKKYEFKECDNIWLDDNGFFMDNHYIIVRHSKSTPDIAIPVTKAIKEQARAINNSLYSEKPEQAPQQAPEQAPQQAPQQAPEQEQPENDPEINKYYDANGNCIDFDGLAAYLDKKRLEQQEKESEKRISSMEKPSIEVGIAQAFKGVLDEKERRWVCINKNDLYEELVFALTERGAIEIPTSLFDTVKYKILSTLDGSSIEFKEVGIDDKGVPQFKEIPIVPNYIYLVEIYRNNWKKYYLMQVNGNHKDRVKLQCLSDWAEKTDDVDFSIFIKKYKQWVGRKEYLRTSDWS